MKGLQSPFKQIETEMNREQDQVYHLKLSLP